MNYLKNKEAETDIQMDELQTIEHTKCKPISIPMVVSTKERKILGFEVLQMPATGHLAKISVQKYGRRPDQRRDGIKRLLKKIANNINKNTSILSDEHPYYPSLIRRQLPDITHKTVKGAKSSIVGQGELKKLKHDPLFAINHTFAMLRANINRLIRRTWCTTKDPCRLADHLAIYVAVHNRILTAC